MSESSRPAPPPPSGISEQAKKALIDSGYSHRPLPALDDAEAWRRRAAEGDRELISHFEGIDLPVETKEQDFGGVRTYVHRPHDVPDTPDTPIFLNIHGGGLTGGGGEACKVVTRAMGLGTGMISWAPDYRMPPDHPYPAALDDCVTVYRALLATRSPEDVFVGGGSAGGNLAAALLVRGREEGLPMPAALVLISPELDLTESGDTFRVNDGIDNVLRSLMPANLLYANGHDLSHPHLSPLFADVTGFPPTFLQSGTRDLFLSNTVRMHRKLRAAGIDAELHIWEAMSHGGFGGAPEDIEVIMEVRRFLDAHRRSPQPRS